MWTEKINELCHYGVKGMKWGVRRYRNYDGSLTSAGRSRQRIYSRRVSRLKTNPEIIALVDKMLEDDKARLGLEKGQAYTNEDEAEQNVRRDVIRKNGKIVAFCDSYIGQDNLGINGEKPLYIAIGTDTSNRGKGYATAAARKTIRWFDKQNEYDELIWSARRDNEASQKIAKSLGFEYSPETSSDTWVDYSYYKRH
jgi:RimJ/RimL family protein N-acetyltransferase